MKKLILQFAISIFLIILNCGMALSANEYFRSVATGNWNATATWQMSTDAGGTWFGATGTPTETSGPITIQSPNTVTVTVSVNADQLAVNSGGTISINASINLTILSGGGDDLVLNSGGTISGSGNLQTQGSGVSMNIHFGSSFIAPLKINTGTAAFYNSDYPNPALFNGTITVDAGATFSVAVGGYFVRANNTVTNNGIIDGNSSTFIMNGSSLINNDTIRTTYFELDTATSLTGTGVYRSDYISVGSSGNISLASNTIFSPANTLTVNSGGLINPNTKVLLFNSGIFGLNSGATVSNSGTFRTQNTVSLDIKSGSNFNVPLIVNTGVTTTYDNSPPYNAIFKGTITIDIGATLHVGDGGYFTQANNNVTVNGSITGSSSTFYMRGASLTNNGSISVTAFEFDSTTSATGTGSYTSSTITIAGSGDVTLISNINFSPLNSFNINSGGKFNPGSKMFTFTSGTFTIFNGGVVSGTGANAGTMQTQGNIYFNFRSGSTFNSAIKVNTGTLTAYCSDAPYIAVFSGTITVDAGATLKAFDGYTIQANNTLTNNGSVIGNSSYFTMRGSVFVNNNSISITNLNFDSTVTLSGTGSYNCSDITIGSSGKITLANNLTFSPLSNFEIDNGGILNPNLKIFTFNSGILTLNPGGTITASGTFQTQGTVSMTIRNGSNFNAPLKVNTGTTTSRDNGAPYIAKFNGAVTVDAGAVLNVFNGGYFIQANSTLTNNGTIDGSSSSLIVRGPSFVNNGIVNPTNINFDTTTSISGAGSYSPTNITISSSGNVSLAGNTSFTPASNFYIDGSGILNPNSFTITVSSTNFTMFNLSTIINSGIFQTQGNILMNIKNGSAFNAPLKVHTGIATAWDNGSPYTAFFKGTVTVDTGATLSTYGGGYSISFNNIVTNYGTITSGGGSTVNILGTIVTNNGIINPSIFNFQTGNHTLQGTGLVGTNLNVVSGSTVTLASNHQLLSVTVNTGGTFNLSTFKLSLTASNPIANSGTFNTTTGAVEYNGTSLQNISTTNITYNKLRINNSAGTSLLNSTTVNDSLSVLLGDLNLNGFVLTLSPAGYLTETTGNTVKGTSGYITTTRNLNAPSSMNVGGLGAVLTTTVNLGSTEIRRGHAVQNGLNGITSILRYFDIIPTTNTGLNATLIYKYDDSELNGKVESALSLYKSTNTGSTWTSQGGTVNTSANTITLAGVGSFSRWSASSASAVASTIKLLLEGFYNTGTGRMNMRDTVRAYLRNPTTPFAVIDSAKSIIDSVTFNGSFLFANAPTGTYYIQTKHRNALETWSKAGGESYTLGSSMNYDFTTDSAKAYGKNMKKSGTKWVFYEGDVNQDGFIDLSDEVVINNDVNIFKTGYVRTDVNGDKIVDLTDLLITYNNAAAFVIKSKP
jgi:hypothetical protein